MFNHINDARKEQNARIAGLYGDIQKSQENDLEKGGEGSKGGKVIGHTKSGKPIYEDKKANDKVYKDFDKQDHLDAHSAHFNQSAKTYKINPDTWETDKSTKSDHHRQISNAHHDLGWKKK